MAIAPKKSKVTSSVKEDKLKLPGLKWSLCSSVDNQIASKCIASFVAYSLYLRQSEKDLHIIQSRKAPSQVGTSKSIAPELEVYVRKDYEPGTFALVPHNMVLYEAGDWGSASGVHLSS